MVDDDIVPSASPFPVDEQASDARWLADLIQAVRTQVADAGNPEVSAILDEAYKAAQAAASEAELKGRLTPGLAQSTPEL